MAFYVQLFQSPPLDFVHANDLAIQALANPFGIRPQQTIDHLRQILHMSDVVNLRILWRDGHRVSV
jgi:hypothetical protein